MSNYKHGDWYCKPANEAEAREIIDRALASGANNRGGWAGNADTYLYGVFNGCVFCDSPEDDINGNQYTIEQVREKFPLPSDRVEKEPIYTHEYNDRGVYEQCTMVVSEADTSGRVLIENRYGEYDLAYQADIRPIRSESQANVEPHFEHEQKEFVRSDVDVRISSKPDQWDGNGFPPVGTICDLIGCGITVEIIAHAENNTGMVAVFKYYDYNGVLTVDFKPASWFHPIKTEREQFVERVHDRYDGGAHHSTVMALAGFIYDALKSGDLKAPEVDK